MGAFLKLVDAILFLFFLLVAIASPLIGSQAFPCNEHLPRAVVDLDNWYNRSFGDYLMAERPHFFVGIVWLELVLLWPLSLINLYGILIAGPWLSTTCLIYGASFFTGMVNFQRPLKLMQGKFIHGFFVKSPRDVKDSLSTDSDLKMNYLI